MPRSRISTSGAALALVAIVAATGWGAALLERPAPALERIDPPGWWPAHPVNPLRLLISGRNLGETRLRATGGGLKVGQLRHTPEGYYLFADLYVEPGAKPGRYELIVESSGGSARAPFELLEPLPSRNNLQGLSSDDVIYLIMPDRFADGDPSNNDPPESAGLYNRSAARAFHGGDLQGIIDRLDYLRDLGVTAIWTTPIYDNHNSRAESYHGYSPVNYYRVEEHFGDLAKYRELVERAHLAGIKIIQDQVLNHTGPHHPWVERPPLPSWFNGTPAKHLKNPFNFPALCDPHATAAEREPTLDGWFADLLPDLNQREEEVARYLVQNSLWWVGIAGLDGVRLDTFPLVPRSFWQRWSAEVKRCYPRLWVVGEVFHESSEVVAFFQGGRARFDGVDSGAGSLFDFPLYHAIREVFARDAPMERLVSVLRRDWLYEDPQALVTFLGNHDVRRFASEAGRDQRRLRLAFSFLLTARGIPQIYYGDEIGMEGGEDPDNRRDFPGGFPGDERNAFARGRSAEEEETFQHVRGLLRLRSRQRALRRGSHINLYVSRYHYAYLRQDGEERALVVINNSDREARLTLELRPPDTRPHGEFEEVLIGLGAAVAVDGKINVAVPARAAAVYLQR